MRLTKLYMFLYAVSFRAQLLYTYAFTNCQLPNWTAGQITKTFSPNFSLGVFINFLVKSSVIFQLNWFIKKVFVKEKEFILPEPGEDCVTLFSRPRILQTEKSVSDLLETGAGTAGSDSQTRDLLACAERTRKSTSATTDWNCVHSILTNLINLLP